MPDRRTARLSDWLNGGMGALMVLAASWAGSKLVDVREEVSSMKAMMDADNKRIDKIELEVERNEKRIDKIEVKIGLVR